MKKIDFSLLNETISPNNVEVLSELIALSETKYLTTFIGVPMIVIRNNLYQDIYRKHESNYQVSDSYDLVQICALFLCEHFGKKLSDVHHFDKKGKKISIHIQAIREMTKSISQQSRRSRKEIYLDYLTQQHTPIIELEVDIANDYTKVDNIIESLQLNEMQTLALECRMNGMSYPKIASVIGRATSTSYDILKAIQKRYLSIYS